MADEYRPLTNLDKSGNIRPSLKTTDVSLREAFTQSAQRQYEARAEKNKQRSERLYNIVGEGLNNLRDQYELSRDMRDSVGSIDDVLKWMGKNKYYTKRADETVDDMVANGYSEAEAQSVVQGILMQRAASLFNDYKPDLAYSNKYIINPATMQYEEATEQTADFPSTTGELIRMFQGVAGIDDSHYVFEKLGEDRGEPYKSTSMNIAQTMLASAVAPRTMTSMNDDEYFTKNGNSNFLNVAGDVAEQAITLAPATKLLRFAKLGRMALTAGEKGSPLIAALSRGTKGAFNGAATMVASDAFGSAYDAVLGTNRGYEFNPAADVTIGGAVGSASKLMNGTDSYAKSLIKLENEAKQSDALGKFINRETGGSVESLPKGYIDYYRARRTSWNPLNRRKLTDAEFASKPYQQFPSDTRVEFDKNLEYIPFFEGEEKVSLEGWQRYCERNYAKFGYSSPQEMERQGGDILQALNRQLKLENSFEASAELRQLQKMHNEEQNLREYNREMNAYRDKKYKSDANEDVKTSSAGEAERLVAGRNLALPENPTLEDVINYEQTNADFRNRIAKADAEYRKRHTFANLAGHQPTETKKWTAGGQAKDIAANLLIPIGGTSARRYDYGSFISPREDTESERELSRRLSRYAMGQEEDPAFFIPTR